MSPRTSFKSVACVGVLFLVLFGIFVARLKGGETFSWDEPILYRFHDQIPYAKKLVWPSVLVGPVVALAAIGLLLRKQRFAAAIGWGAAVGGILVLDPALKALVARPELNPMSNGYSFPSGSAMLLLAATIVLIVSLPAARRPCAAVGGAALVLYQGAMLVSIRWHYPSDVVAGWCVTVAWLAAVWLTVAAFTDGKVRQRTPVDDPS